MGKYINKKTLIDPETGEILKESNWLGYDGFNEKGYKYRYKANKISYFSDSLPANLSKDAFFLLMMIAELLNEDNVLVRRVERKSKFSSIIYKPLYKEEIRERTRYTYGMNKFDKCWVELNKRCLKQVQYYDYKVWAVNPAIINKCKYVPYWLYDEFKESMNPYLTATTIKRLYNKTHGI